MTSIATGHEQDGYRFNGGDPSQQSSWEPVGLQAGFIEDGYQFNGGDPSEQANWAPIKPTGPRSALRAIGDTALQFGKGAVSGARMLTDVAGADNAASAGLRSVDEALGDLLSASAKQDQARVAEIMQEAEGKGWMEQIGLGLKAAGVAPAALLAQAAGTSLPTLATALIPGAGPAALATRMGIAGAVGGAQGVGATKGAIYENTKNELLQAGVSPEEAEARAAEQQSYAGESAGQIALGGGLGVLAGSTGMERVAAGLRSGVTKAAPGLMARVGAGGAVEAVPEMIQGGQEKYATNSALANEGFEVDPMSGVVANATMEGVAGFGMGAAFGIPKARVINAPGTPDAPALQIGNAPDPMISFPDGTVARKSEVDTFINTLPEDQRPAARAKIMGLAPQPADPVAEIGNAQSVDEAIAAAQAAISAPMTLTGMDRAGLMASADNPLLGAAREREADAADLQSLRDSETRNLQVMRAQMAMDQAKQAELDQIPAMAAEQNTTKAAVQRASALDAPTAMGSAFDRLIDRTIAPEPEARPEPEAVAPAEPRIVERTPDMKPMPRDLAELQVDMDGGELVRIQNRNGKFAYTVIPKDANDSRTADVQPLPAGSSDRGDSVAPSSVAPALGLIGTDKRAVGAGLPGDSPSREPVAPAGGVDAAAVDSKADEVMRHVDEMGGTSITRDQVKALIKEKGMAAADKSIAGFKEHIAQRKKATNVQNQAPGANPAPAAPTVEAPPAVAGNAAATQGLPAATGSSVEGGGVAKVEKVDGVNSVAQWQGQPVPRANLEQLKRQAESSLRQLSKNAAEAKGTPSGDVWAKQVTEKRQFIKEIDAALFQPQGTPNAQAPEAIEAKPSAPSQADPRLIPVSQRAKGAEVSRYNGKYGKGMNRGAAKLEALRLNKANQDKAVAYTAEEHDDPKLENPWAVVGRKAAPARPTAAASPVAGAVVASQADAPAKPANLREAIAQRKAEKSTRQEKLDALPYLPIKELKVGDEFEAEQTSRRAKTGGTITSIGPVNITYTSEYMGKPMEGLKLSRGEVTLIVRDGVLHSTQEKTSDGKAVPKEVLADYPELASQLDVPSDQQVADSLAKVDALTDDEAKAAAARMGKKLTPRMDAKETIKQEHPDDIAHVLAGDSWNGKGWDKAVEPAATTTARSPEADHRAAMEDVTRRRAEQDSAQPAAKAEPAAQASAILDAASITGKERIDVLKDVKKGDITTEELQAAYPAKESAAPITDAGEKIGGARKDKWKERGLDLNDLDGMSESEGAEMASKANVWKPDYEAMAEATEPVTAAMVKTVYDQLAAQPKKNTPEGRRNYVTMMQAVRAAYLEAKTPQEVKDAGAKLKQGIGLYSTDPATKEKAREVLFSVYKGRSDPFVLSYNELSKAKKMVEDGFPAKGEPWKKRLSIRAYTSQGFTPRGIELTLSESAELGTPLTSDQIVSGFYRINTKDGKAVGYAPTREDADATAKTIYERDLKKGASDKPEPIRPSLDELKRENLPGRIDRDVTADDFVKDLGFRGVEFGNWAAQDERQRIINMAYDGLMDLAEIMGVPPKAMSLNGTMGMAFGARGGGKFAAHYEPGKLVINMTKINGGGSMAHEWAHALDHYFGELNQKDAYTTKARGASGWYDEQQYKSVPQTRMEKDAAGKWVNVSKMRLSNMRPEMAKAFDGVMSALFSGQETKAQMVRSEELSIERYQALADKETDADTKAMYLRGIESRKVALEELRQDPDDKTYPKGRSAYAGQAQKLVGKSATGYWTRPTEMFARAFESWVFDKVVAMGARSDYLVHGVEEDRFAGGNYKGNPYPTGAERATINAAFDNLAGTIQTKEDDAGNVAMFSRAGAELSPGDEFWRKIKAGEKFTQQEVQDGYSIGRRGATRTSAGMAGTAPIVGAQAAIKDTGWREKIAGFDGYRTVGVAVEDGSFVMGVIPESLFKGTSLQAIDRTAIVRYRFVPVGGSFRLDVLDADYRSLAIQELAANNELKTTRHTDEAGDPYFKIDIGTTTSRALLQEAVRRLALHTGKVPTITQDRRDTGSRAGKSSQRVFSADTIETKFSLAGEKPAAVRNPSTVERVQAAVTEFIGAKQLPNQLGRVVATTAAEIKSHWEPLIDKSVNIGSEGDAGVAQAFFDPRTKTVFLIADHISQGNEAAVLAHELMHKHGQAVLGKDGWDRLHGVISSWKDAPSDSEEHAVYTYARNKVAAVGDNLSSQELFPYAVEAALKMGIQPSMAAKKGTVARWLESVRQNMQQVWAKVTGKPEAFKALDLVDLAFGIAQRENPANAMKDFRGTNGPMTNKDVVGNQGGRSADDSTPGALIPMISEVSNGEIWNFLPIEVVIDRNMPWTEDPRLDVLKNGRAKVTYRGGGDLAAPGGIKRFVYDEIRKVFERPVSSEFFWRFTNNKNELSYIKNGELRPSLNHVENKREKGVSVDSGVHYLMQGYKYGYRVSGEIVGTGSDGETLLNANTIRPLSKLIDSEKIRLKDYSERNEHLSKSLAKYGWTREQYDAALSGVKVFESKKYHEQFLSNESTAPDSGGAMFSRSTVDDAMSKLRQTFGQPRTESASAYAEQNRRIREEHVTAWDKGRKWLKRQLTPAGLLPQSVFDIKIDRDAGLEAIEFDVAHMVGALERVVKAEYKVSANKLDETTQRLLSDVMAGKIGDVPDGTKAALLGMRQYIDKMTVEYLNLLETQRQNLLATAELSGDNRLIGEAAERAGLIEAITANVGQYVHRSYRAFDDKGWALKVPDTVLDGARSYLLARYAEDGTPNAESRAEVVLSEILKHGTAYENMEAFIKESKLGAKDLSVLKKRKQIAPEIRALLGEYTDPRLNFSKSATKMSHLIFNQRFLDRVRELGMGEFLFTDDTKPPEATVKIAGEQSDVYAPLNGLWTTPETNQAFKDALGKEQMEDWYRTIVKMNGFVKYGKTVLSPTTAARNWMSAFFFTVANGHFDMTHMAKSVSLLKEYFGHRSDAEKMAYLRELKVLGVIYDTPYAGEMMRLLADTNTESILNTGKALPLKKALGYATKFYQYGDDFWKVIGFENEKRMLVDAGYSETDAKKEAAARIRDTYPTYSMVGRGIQSLRRFPLAGSFVSFPAEIIRTSYNMLRYLEKDYKNPAMRSRAIKRATGLAIASSFAYALQAVSMAMLGYDDDDEEAIRLMAAPWQKNSNLLFTGRDAEGKIRFLDLSFLDPYNYWKRPIIAVTRGQPWREAVKDVAGETLSPFFGTDIAAGAIFDAMANKKGSGGTVYNEHDAIGNQVADIGNHLRKSLQPGLFANMERTFKALNGEVTPSGKQYDLADEALGWVGFRVATLDPKVALFYRSFDFKDAKSNAEKHMRDALRDPGDVSGRQLRNAHSITVRLRDEAYSDMQLLVTASMKSGLSRQDIHAALKNSGVSQKDIFALMSGKVPAYLMTPESVRNIARKSRDTFGPEAYKRVINRYREVLSYDSR